MNTNNNSPGSTLQWESLFGGMMQGGQMEIPRGGVTNVSVSPVLSVLLNMMIAPLELTLMNSMEGASHLAEANAKANKGISSFGESLLDVQRLLSVIRDNPNAALSVANNNTLNKSQLVLISDMLATLYYIRDAIRKEQSTQQGEGTGIANVLSNQQKVSIAVAGEHILYLNMFAMSVMYGVRVGNVGGVNPERLDQLIGELYQNKSVTTNNPIEMILLYFMDITAQYTQKVGKQTITAEDLKSILTSDGQLNIDKLRDILAHQ